jgi:hypothetical protein
MRLLSLRNLFQRPLLRSGRKALMPDPSSPIPAVPPADADRLSAVLGAVSRLAEQQQSLLELFRSAAPPAGARPAGLTAELRDLVTGLFRQHQAATTRSGARDAYLREHAADLPEAYRRLMPETDDPSALSAAEQSIRRQFRDDFKVVVRSPDGSSGQNREAPRSIAGQAAGGSSPAAAVDYSRLSPLQQIAVGLRGAPTQRAAPAPAIADESAESDDMDSADALFVGAD